MKRVNTWKRQRQEKSGAARALHGGSGCGHREAQARGHRHPDLIMPVTLLNGFVLLSHPADWSEAPAWQRVWQTGITAALTGAEQRQAMRAAPRNQLAYVVSTLSLEERAVLDGCLDAASVSGLACAPFWGRASALQAAANANSATLVDNSWGWQPGDYAFFQSAIPSVASSYLLYDAIEVTAVNRTTLTLAGNVSRNYPAGALMWPIISGKFRMEKENAETSWHGDVKVTITELAARDQAAVGDAPGAPGPGIGSWAIGSTLIVQ